jgi:hypothetical protein
MRKIISGADSATGKRGFSGRGRNRESVEKWVRDEG